MHCCLGSFRLAGPTLAALWGSGVRQCNLKETKIECSHHSCNVLGSWAGSVRWKWPSKLTCLAGRAAAPKSSTLLLRPQAALDLNCYSPSCHLHHPIYCSFVQKSQCIIEYSFDPAPSFQKLHLLNWGSLFGSLYSYHSASSSQPGLVPSPIYRTAGALSPPYGPDAPGATAEAKVSLTRFWAGTQRCLQNGMSCFGLDCVGAKAGRSKCKFSRPCSAPAGHNCSRQSGQRGGKETRNDSGKLLRLRWSLVPPPARPPPARRPPHAYCATACSCPLQISSPQNCCILALLRLCPLASRTAGWQRPNGCYLPPSPPLP